MLDLAEHAGLGPVQSHEIARRQQIPEPYLNQLLALVRKAGLVVSRRGPGGGHLLARPASDVTLAELVAALEGPFWSTDEAPGEPSWGSRSLGLQEVLREVAEATECILSRVTLADIAERERQRAYTYQI